MKKVINYIDYCTRYLIKRYGQVAPEWEMTLDLLQNTLMRYYQVKEAIDHQGIYNPETGAKNQLIATEKDLLASIMKLQQKLGISPYDTAKIKQNEEDDSELLSAIMGED